MSDSSRLRAALTAQIFTAWVPRLGDEQLGSEAIIARLMDSAYLANEALILSEIIDAKDDDRFQEFLDKRFGADSQLYRTLIKPKPSQIIT